MRLEGKVAIITGGARGQGEAEARLFAREGAKVIIGDVLDEEGVKVAADISESGGEAVFVHLDVTSEEDWRDAIGTAVSSFGKLDVLVNNAAIWRLGMIEHTTPEEWDAVLDVNAKGVFLGTRGAIPEMRKAGRSIINISSTSGIVGSRMSAAYGASKGALRLFTKATAVQYGKEGIRANAIHPGPIDTPMAEYITTVTGRRLEESRVNTVLGRRGKPEEIAYGALYLASDESSFVTGSDLVIDGGVTAQ